jgi:hypothetical protein
VAFFAGDKTLAVLSMELALEFLCRMLLRGTENAFLEPCFQFKPRQARDKHVETLKKRRFSQVG